MKKYSLIKSFTIYSLIAFTLTGIVLVYLILGHIRVDKFENLKNTTQFTIDNIIVNNLVETDFDGIISSSKKNYIVNSINKAMAFYNPQSIVLFNSKKTVILISSPLDNMLLNVSYDNVDKVLTSNIPYVISKSYIVKSIDNATGKKAMFDIYVPVKHQEKIVGVLILQIPDAIISSHVNMTIQAIALTLSGGLCVLFILLLNILYTTSRTLIKQNSELSEQKTELETSYKKLNDSYKNTVSALSNAVDARDPYTAGHSERVTKISMLLGTTLDLPEKELADLEYAALFHDIGKIGIPDYILHKTGKLTDEEFEIIKKHPEMGVNILKSIDFLAESLPIIKHHHEKFRGKGYPDNINGEDIPLGARIIAIADTYDAMTTDRPYRQGLSHETAVEEILRNKGLQFDDKLVDAFMEIEQSIKLESLNN